MNIFRKHEIAIEDVADCRIGDQIQAGKYTATCMKVKDGAAIFLLDQYLDKEYHMNPTDTNNGGYEYSELRRALQFVAHTGKIFTSVKGYMRPFENNDLLRLPTVGEMFGHYKLCEPDDAEQWELMKERRNRIAERNGVEYECGWLQNAALASETSFAYVFRTGYASFDTASNMGGVRPVFQLVF